MMKVARSIMNVTNAKKLSTRPPRQTCVQVRNTYHFIRSSLDFKKNTGAYAVNEMIVNMNHDEYDEDNVREVIKEFAMTSKGYYNLRRLKINAPYAVLEGSDIADLMSIPSTFTDLELDLFAFHTPQEDMWKACTRLQNIRITFHDGIGFPDAASQLLKGIETCKNLESVRLHNESPHMPRVYMDITLKKKMVWVTGYSDVHYIKTTKQKKILPF